jgi:hypothetical protein
MQPVGKAAPFGVSLLLGACLLTLPPFSNAQGNKTDPCSPCALRSGREGRVRVPDGDDLAFLELPASCVRFVPLGGGISTESFGPPLLTQPLLYSSEPSFVAGDDVDPLWSFPTIGFDPRTKPGKFSYVYSTVEDTSAMPSINRSEEIAYGQIGQPALINQFVVAGGIFKVKNGSQAGGKILVYFYDGVDAAHPPNWGSSHATGHIGGNVTHVQPPNNSYHGYLIDIPDTSEPGYYYLDMTQMYDPAQQKYIHGGWTIKDPQGRFGMAVAKFSDATTDGGGHTMPEVQFGWAINATNGPNRAWSLTTGSQYMTKDAPTTLKTRAANSVFKQSPTYNHLFELHGQALNLTLLNGLDYHGGVLQGNLRRRGVCPAGKGTAAETAPGFYRIDFCPHGTNTLKRSECVFTQPSYDKMGALTVNYKIEGIPAGTYDITYSQMPIFDSAGHSDILTGLFGYPGADFLPQTLKSVLIASDGVTTRNVRLERLGDINHDGVVNITDLGLFADAFGSVRGSERYNPAADLIGMDSTPPDGIIDISDLGILADEFDQGVQEP